MGGHNSGTVDYTFTAPTPFPCLYCNAWLLQYKEGSFCSDLQPAAVQTRNTLYLCWTLLALQLSNPTNGMWCLKILQALSGMWTAIRNPRSSPSGCWSQQTAKSSWSDDSIHLTHSTVMLKMSTHFISYINFKYVQHNFQTQNDFLTSVYLVVMHMKYTLLMPTVTRCLVLLILFVLVIYSEA
jgi:hypothetical protein